jgi:hypothetical protein
MSSQWLLSRALYIHNCLDRDPRAPANLFSASSCSSSEGQRLLEATMKGLLPALIVASEPLNHPP